MSDNNRSYQQEVKHFSEIVDEFKDELRSFKNEIRQSLDKMSDQIEKNRTDANMLTEGNARHGVKSVREVAESARVEAERANERLDNIKYIIIGASSGGAIGGAGIIKLLESILL